MKKILLALTLIGAISYSAEAQSKKSQFAKNYKMCLADNSYKPCDEAAIAQQEVGRDVKTTAPSASLRMLDSYTHLGYSTAEGQSNRKNPRIVVSYEGPSDAYDGKETRLNDGVQKNKVRNINYLDTSVDLPSVDGN